MKDSDSCTQLTPSCKLPIQVYNEYIVLTNCSGLNDRMLLVGGRGAEERTRGGGGENECNCFKFQN